MVQINFKPKQKVSPDRDLFVRKENEILPYIKENQKKNKNKDYLSELKIQRMQKNAKNFKNYLERKKDDMNNLSQGSYDTNDVNF